MSESSSASNTRLRPAVEADAPVVLLWRNHPTVRRVMFTNHEITAEEHAAWWARVQASPDHRMLIVVHDEVDCGVVTFTRHADEADTWVWAFYLGPDAFPESAQLGRAWRGLERESLHWAEHELAARRVDCEVFAFNGAVLALHKRHGFVETDRYQRQRGDETLEVVRLYREFPQAA